MPPGPFLPSQFRSALPTSRISWPGSLVAISATRQANRHLRNHRCYSEDVELFHHLPSRAQARLHALRSLDFTISLGICVFECSGGMNVGIRNTARRCTCPVTRCAALLRTMSLTGLPHSVCQDRHDGRSCYETTRMREVGYSCGRRDCRRNEKVRRWEYHYYQYGAEVADTPRSRARGIQRKHYNDYYYY